LTDSGTNQVSRRELRDFGLIVGAVCAALFGILLPFLKHRAFPVWPWIVALALVVPALAFPSGLRGPHFVWMKFGSALGWINQRIVLTMIFYIILMPIGLMMRAFGRDPMARGFEGNRESYRVASRASPPRSMTRPF
jgi:hypothetical protein